MLPAQVIDLPGVDKFRNCNYISYRRLAVGKI